MSSTKIINVLKDDKFEELLDIVTSADASEVIFVLPKKARAFRSEAHFAILEKESKETNKSIAFMCSDAEANELAKKYKFDVLTTGSGSKPRLSRKAGQAQPIAVPVAVKNDDIDDIEEEPAEEDGKDYKKSEPEEETVEEDAPYGTELDESGDPIYDEEEEKIGEVVIASAKTRGMGDIVRPSAGKNIKVRGEGPVRSRVYVAQKDNRPIKLETRKEPMADLDWGSKRSDNIWSDIAKPIPNIPRKRGLGFIPKNFFKKGVAILSIAAIVVLVSVVYLTTGSAKIEIKPRSQELGAQMKVVMSPNFSSVDSSFNRVPGQLFTLGKSASGEFNATAEKDAVQKSRGTITIYNEYSTSSQALVATTRFEYIQDEKVSGFVFRTLQTIIVPGMKVENGVTTPGKIDVEVIADKAGQTYNVPAGDFGVMTWREKGDTARYEKIYGRSSESMHGGILGKAKVVSEFDYNTAKNKLTEKVKNEIAEALKAQSAGLELVTVIEPKIDSVESTAKMDDAAETFTMTVKGSIATIGYKKDDLLSLISQYVDKTNDLMVVSDKLEISYKEAVMDTTDSTLSMVATLGGQGYAKIDKADITANLIGKNEVQIKSYLSSIQDIDSAKVILSPFWVKKMPKNEEKIDISLTY